MKKDVKWLKLPETHDFPAAESYLSLLFDKKVVDILLTKLRAVKECTPFKAKDVLRASGLSPLGMGNSHIEKNSEKIKKGESLSPIIIIRDSQKRKVIIADGYHRLCTVYITDEDVEIPAIIVSL